MYPSVIMSLNISPEMKVGKVNGWSAEEFMKNTEKSYTVNIIGNKDKIWEKLLLALNIYDSKYH